MERLYIHEWGSDVIFNGIEVAATRRLVYCDTRPGGRISYGLYDDRLSLILGSYASMFGSRGFGGFDFCIGSLQRRRIISGVHSF